MPPAVILSGLDLGRGSGPPGPRVGDHFSAGPAPRFQETFCVVINILLAVHLRFFFVSSTDSCSSMCFYLHLPTHLGSARA